MGSSPGARPAWSMIRCKRLRARSAACSGSSRSANRELERHRGCLRGFDARGDAVAGDALVDAVPLHGVGAALATLVKFEPNRARVTDVAGAALAPLLALLQAQPALRIANTGH